MVFLTVLTAVLISASGPNAPVSPPESPSEVYYSDAPEVRALPDLAVWVSLTRSGGFSETKTFVDIGKVWNGPRRERQWTAQWSFFQEGGDGKRIWGEASVPLRTSDATCPALSGVVKRIQRYLKNSKVKSRKGEVLPDAWERELVVYPDYPRGVDRKRVYTVYDHETDAAELSDLMINSDIALKDCWPPGDPKVYRTSADFYTIPDPIQIAPRDPPTPPPVPWTLPEPDPPKAN
jgi:hypothetical protein